MVVKLTAEQITQIIDYIQGSCESLDNVINIITEDAIDGLDEVENWQELCDRLDQCHFLCDKCGWWSEAGDYAENQDDSNGGDICSSCGDLED